MAKAINHNNQIIRGIPKIWTRPNGEQDHSYHLRGEEVHFADGWRNVVIPEITENQRLGALFFDAEKDFIPFEELTKEIVVGWVEESLGEEEIEKIILSLEKQIENQKNPPIKIGLPWQE